MSATALAYKCNEIDEDLTALDRLTVECGRCDEDNPLAIPPDKCPVCHGTRRAPVSFAAIMKELQESKTQQGRDMAKSQNDELYLEY
jgi:hypothetical protein